MLDLPLSGMETTSSALSSSRERSTRLCSASACSSAPRSCGAGAGAGKRPPFEQAFSRHAIAKSLGFKRFHDGFVPLGIGSANGGGGGGVGRQLKQHERRQSPPRPVPSIGRGPDEEP